MKYLIVFVIIAAIGGAGAGVGVHMHRASVAAAAAAAEKTAVVSRGPIFQAVNSTGKVVANLDVDIKCRASGVVVKLPYDISQKVKQGDLLLELDTVDEDRAVKRAEAAVAQSQAKLREAEENLVVGAQSVVTAKARAEAGVHAAEVKAKSMKLKADRRKELIDEKLGSVEDLEAAQIDAAAAQADLETAHVSEEEAKTQEAALEVKRRDIDVAKATLDADNIALADAKQQLDYCKVYAPMDGVVSALNTQVGSAISSVITNIGGGTTVLTLSDLTQNHIFVLASVDESDIVKVALGQKVIVTADAVTGRTFEGKVVRIATKGTNVSNVVTFEVKIELTGDANDILKPEMTANVQIVQAQKPSVLFVPTDAILREGGQDKITIVNRNGTREDRPVKLGLSDGDNVEVISGVNEGETVLLQSEPASKFSNETRQPPPPRPAPAKAK
ncbi:MAG TPA: efflux RND transporter periplasmic adaptor subunit [Tepidisphaeraceae bacterium]|jgi:HlyD family secretion protein|nr:efflux RND transporter periplasmic adaptor subunit [Tepidisphaeraceae bacterium]